MEKTIKKAFPISLTNSLSEDVPTFIELYPPQKIIIKNSNDFTKTAFLKKLFIYSF